MLMLFETMITFTVHVFQLFGSGWAIWLNWVYCAVVNLNFAFNAVLRGDGTLTLARRSDTSTPGCAVLLDQDFAVVLNGNQSVVEAIAESSFNLSHPDSVWGLRVAGEDHGRDSYQVLGALCEGACLTAFALCWLLFPPSTLGGLVPLAAVIFIVAYLQQMFPPDQITSRRTALLAARFPSRVLPPLLYLAIYTQVTTGSPIFAFSWHFLSAFLLGFFLAGYKPRNYPIRSAKFLDALGNPPVRKWQFDTLAAAVTFQCLILCRGFPRPIRSIDILAFLDMLIPDQRDVWTAWKERVADRISHETDILFTPTIPTFGDERQQRLTDLLDQAQFGYDSYRRFYVQRVPLHPMS